MSMFFVPKNFINIPEYNSEKRQHYWVIMSTYSINIFSKESLGILDRENLVSLQGPGCYYCYEVFAEGKELTLCKGIQEK